MKNQCPCPDLLAKLDWDFLEVLLEVMEPFAKATAAMEADKHPPSAMWWAWSSS